MYLQQQVFIALFSIIGIVGLYRGLFAGEIYQKIIGFVGFIVAIIFIILLVWGLHYLKDIKRKIVSLIMYYGLKEKLKYSRVRY